MSFFRVFRFAVLLFCGLALRLQAQKDATEVYREVGQLYHNTTSHYNALFIARAQLKAIKSALREQELPGSEETLSVYLRYDSTQTSALEKEVVDCIKKSSLILQYHPMSKWSDEAYLILGQSRHYHNEKRETVKALQYLSRKGQEAEMRMAAQVMLLRTYVHDSLLNEAQQVATYISRDPPRGGDNRLHYLLGIAYLAQRLQRTEDLIRYLRHALPLARGDKYLQTRLHFILGQSYERVGQDDLAYSHYRRVAKRILPYDFYLEAKLRAWATAPQPNAKALYKLRKRFRTQLREQKNKELRYKIHFHWARMEHKRGRLPKAQQQYAASVATNKGDGLLLGRGYEVLANMYYSADQVPQAAAYYDSAARALPEEASGYLALQQRAEIFKRLGAAYELRYKEDSLLRISELSQDSLLVLVRAKRAAELEAARLQAETEASLLARASDVSRRSSLTGLGQEEGLRTSTLAGGSWYFYNQTQLSAGRKTFEKTWGKRPLGDNWRRNSSELISLSSSRRRALREGNFTDDFTPSPVEAKEDTISVAELLADIPQDSASKSAALERLQGAYHEIGSIYYFELIERSKGRAVFIELMRRFPTSAYTARILYLLAKDDSLSVGERSSYAAALAQQFADSIYTRLLHNPNYLIERAAAVRELQASYKTAYEAYKKGDYLTTRARLRDQLKTQDEPNSFTDNAYLLDILTEAKLGAHYLYQYRLRGWMEDFPESELMKEAKALLKAAEEVQSRKIYSSKPKYLPHKRGTHALIWACPHRDLNDALNSKLRAFAQAGSLQLPSRPEVILLNKDQWVVFLPNFVSSRAAWRFLNDYESSGLPEKLSKTFPNQEARPFVISKSNLLILFETKNLDYYEQFFQQHYQP